MPPSTGQPATASSWKRVEKGLRKLHRRGLRYPRLDDLNDLVAVARCLSNKPTDREMVEDTLAQGIDACWGGVRETGPTLRDAMRLWFGLPAVDDPTAPDTRALTSTERHKAAHKHWVRLELEKGEKLREVEKTFCTSQGTKRYEALAKKLVELAEQAGVAPTAMSAEVSPPPVTGAHQTLVRPPTSQAAEDTTSADCKASLPNSRQRRLTKKRLISVLALLVITGLVMWTLWPSSNSNAIPPLGAVVNAQTGRWSLHVPITPAKYPAQIGGGPIFAAADLSTTRKYVNHGEPLKVHIGDIIEFSVTLNNGSNYAVPYVKLNADWHPQTLEPPSRELYVNMVVRWPTQEGGSTEPDSQETTDVKPARIQLPAIGHYDLVYIPKSSRILNPESHFFHSLPDGILNNGIALQDVGQPSGCFWCAEEYIRFVNFLAQVRRG
jgi:hypothetical protein